MQKRDRHVPRQSHAIKGGFVGAKTPSPQWAPAKIPPHSGEVRGFQRDQPPAEPLLSFLPTTPLLGSQGWLLAINCLCGLFVTASCQTCDTKLKVTPLQMAEPGSQLAAPERGNLVLLPAPFLPCASWCVLESQADDVCMGNRQSKVCLFTRSAMTAPYRMARAVSLLPHGGGGQ